MSSASRRGHRTSLSDSEAEHDSESESQFKNDTSDIILAVIGEEDEPQTSNIPIAKTGSGEQLQSEQKSIFLFFNHSLQGITDRCAYVLKK